MMTARKPARLVEPINPQTGSNGGYDLADSFAIRPTPYNGYVSYNLDNGYDTAKRSNVQTKSIDRFQATPYNRVSLADMQARVAAGQSIFGDDDNS